MEAGVIDGSKWGTRGSVPASGEAYLRYGGATICVFLSFGDQNIVLDCGTGMMDLAEVLPLEYGTLGMLAVLALVVFGSYVGYVYQKKSVRWDRVTLFTVLGLVPYVRYLVLHNHA